MQLAPLAQVSSDFAEVYAFAVFWCASVVLSLSKLQSDKIMSIPSPLPVAFFGHNNRNSEATATTTTRQATEMLKQSIVIPACASEVQVGLAHVRRSAL